MRRSLHIEAPVETVFGYFKDPANWRDIMPGEMPEMKVTKDGIGTFVSWRFKVAGIPIEGFQVLTDVVPNRHITERSSSAAFGTWDYTFEPEGSGTQVTMTVRPGSFWRFPPFAQFVAWGESRMADRLMPIFKAKIEAMSRPPVKAAG